MCNKDFVLKLIYGPNNFKLYQQLMTSLRVCVRNKDLIKGTSIHDDLCNKGLLRKCWDALVILYAKYSKFGWERDISTCKRAPMLSHELH